MYNFPTLPVSVNKKPKVSEQVINNMCLACDCYYLMFKLGTTVQAHTIYYGQGKRFSSEKQQ